jgi:hypothetical protein
MSWSVIRRMASRRRLTGWGSMSRSVIRRMASRRPLAGRGRMSESLTKILDAARLIPPVSVIPRMECPHPLTGRHQVTEIKEIEGRGPLSTADSNAAVEGDPSGSTFNGSQIAEGIVSGLFALIVFIGAVSNMPGGEIQRLLMPVVKPIAVATGLDQHWSMFAPNPPRRLDHLEVHVTLADGRHRVWTPPQSEGRVTGVASSHRWRKLKETLVTEAEVRPEFAHWAMGELTEPDERAVRIQIILRTEDLPPPGASRPSPIGVEII